MATNAYQPKDTDRPIVKWIRDKKKEERVCPKCDQKGTLLVFDETPTTAAFAVCDKTCGRIELDEIETGSHPNSPPLMSPQELTSNSAIASPRKPTTLISLAD